MFFDNKARIPSFGEGYDVYCKRSKRTPQDRVLTRAQYTQVIRDYCAELASRLENEGVIDLPCDIGSIAAVNIRRKPTYNKRTGKWRSTNVIDWQATKETGEKVYKERRFTFGFIFSPRRQKGYENFRCYGIRANGKLYERMRKRYEEGTLPFYLFDIENYV